VFKTRGDAVCEKTYQQSDTDDECKGGSDDDEGCFLFLSFEI
jgi:hypothetical protein